MSELTNILDELKTLGFVMNPPASEYQIASFQTSINADNVSHQAPSENNLSNDIFELYRHHNGMPYSHSNWQLFDMRFMSVEEAIQFNIVMRNFYAMHDTLLAPILNIVRFLWQDDNSNAMGIYVSGDLKGKILVLHHENPDLSPCFSSITEMYKQWLSCAKFNFENKETIEKSAKAPCWAMGAWNDFENTEYPRLAPSEFDEAELKIAQSLIEKAKSTTKKRTGLIYLLIAMNLIPFPYTERLLPFLDSEDMFIQERAVKYLSLRKVKNLVEPFGNVVIKGAHNGRLAAITALGRIGTNEAEQKLLELIGKIESNWKDSIARTLHHHFRYEYKRIDKSRSAYRKSPKDEWIEF